MCRAIIQALEKDKIADKNPANAFRTTPIHCAAESGHLDICSLIIDSLKHPLGCYPKDRNGQTPFHRAAKNGHLNICKLIFERVEAKDPAHIDPQTRRLQRNPPDRVSGRTPLHLAAQNGHWSVCEFIMGNIEDKNPSRNDGITPLHEAALSGYGDICLLILSNLKVFWISIVL